MTSVQYKALQTFNERSLYSRNSLRKQAGFARLGKSVMSSVGDGIADAARAVRAARRSAITAAGLAAHTRAQTASRAVRDRVKRVGKAVMSPDAFRSSFKVGEKAGRGAAVLGHVAAAAAAHAGTATAGAAKGFTQKGFIEPVAKWVTKHPEAVAKLKKAGKVAGYTAAGLGAAGLLAGGEYAVNKAMENNVEYGSRQPQRYY